jgi:hypothetical protein
MVHDRAMFRHGKGPCHEYWGMSIGAISPVSPLPPREGSTDRPGHRVERADDQSKRQPDHRHHHEQDPKPPPPPAEPPSDTQPHVDQFA